MKTFIPHGLALPRLQAAAAALQEANERLAHFAKVASAAKSEIKTWLLEERDCDVDQATVGEVLHISGVAFIEITGQKRFDEEAFQMAAPELHASFKKTVAVRRYRPVGRGERGEGRGPDGAHA